MESLQQQLVYKENESPSVFLIDEYETLVDKDFSVFDNMLCGMDEMNIKNIVVKHMGHERFKEVSAYLIEKKMVNIVWHATYSDIIDILQEEIYQFEKGVGIIIKIDASQVKKGDIFNNICRFRERYNNIAAVMMSIDDKYYDDFTDLMEVIYEQLRCTLIVSPQLDEKKNDYISWSKLDILYCNAIEFNKKVNDFKAVLMEYGILPARLLNEHPCNGYVCSKSTCHSHKNDLPRRLILLRDGTVLPESDSINCNLSIGNILEKTLTEVAKEYKDHENHLRFKSIAKDIYTKWIQTCPFRVVPWSRLFIEEAND